MSAKKSKNVPQERKTVSLPQVKADSVSVRMYCHGFGDCFLLTFNDGGSPVFRMLIDCGMLTGNTDTLRQAIHSIRDDSGGHLNLIVQTHEHKDHVSGFNLRDKKTKKLLWDDMEVDQVWLAWTEDTGTKGDQLANDLKKKQDKKKKALARALGLFKSKINSNEHRATLNKEYHGGDYLAAQERYAEALSQVLNFFDIDDASVKTALKLDSESPLPLTVNDAMNYFKDRQKRTGAPEILFWNPGDLADGKVTGLNGVRFYFLGPPKDYDKLRYLEDKTHEEMYISSMGLSDNFYMALEGNDKRENPTTVSPFLSKYFWDSDEEGAKKKESVMSSYRDRNNGWRKIDTDWLHNSGSLALQLDSYTNNTSLVIAIEFEQSGKVLLFPADAQIGNWISWTEVKDKENDEPKLKWQPLQNNSKQVTAKDLLSRTVFYKVGHHASHNATAKKHGLELMESKDLVAMIPVDEEVARKQGKKGWKMPATELYDRLEQVTRGRIVRLDKGNMLSKGIDDLPPGARPTTAQVAEFTSRYSYSKERITTDEGTRRPLFVEYLIG